MHADGAVVFAGGNIRIFLGDHTSWQKKRKNTPDSVFVCRLQFDDVDLSRRIHEKSLPAVLLALLLPVYMGYELYRETVQASVCGYDTAFCAEEKVRAVRFARNMSEEWK